MEKPECMVCGIGANYKLGIDRVPLCGNHKNELRRKAGVGFSGETIHLTRPQIRAVFGFLMVDDQAEKDHQANQADAYQDKIMRNDPRS